MTAIAIVFPGQGSQSVGMLDAWGDHPAVLETLKEASDAMGENLSALIHEGPKEALALTTNTQPVMLVAAIAAYRAWLAEGGAQPAAVAGSKLGGNSRSFDPPKPRKSFLKPLRNPSPGSFPIRI